MWEVRSGSWDVGTQQATDITGRGKKLSTVIDIPQRLNLYHKLSRPYIRMAGKGKLSGEMMKSFDSQGDVVAWLKKAELVAKLIEIKDLASFIPLFLEGDALALYLEMNESDQADAKKIESRLKTAFSQGMFEAYGRLRKLQWMGEQVDVFANKTRRLAGLAGWKGEGLERAVKLAFVTGFLDRISVDLQQVKDIETVEMSELIMRARVLASGAGGQEVAAVATRGQATVGRRQVSQGVSSSRDDQSSKTGEPRGFKGRCFRCNGPHMARDCKEPRPAITCYRCGKEGHIASRCDQGNWHGGAVALEATPSDK